MDRQLIVEELLGAFSSNELSRVIARAGLPPGGSKLNRVYRLIDGGEAAGVAATTILGALRSESLRRVCSRFGIRATTKDEMIVALSSLLGPSGANLARQTITQTSPTLPAVLRTLSELVLPLSLIQSEAEAAGAIARALSRRFAGVASQFGLGGHLGLRADIAVGEGLVGVEVKLARALIASTGELYRAIGQARIYRHLKFGDNLAIAVVGPRQLLGRPLMLEILTLLEATEAGVAYVRLE